MEFLIFIFVTYFIVTIFSKKPDKSYYPSPNPKQEYSNFTTPDELAKILGISPKTLRDWLRKKYTRPPSQKNERWYLTEDQVHMATLHFTKTKKGKIQRKKTSQYRPGQYKKKPKVSPESYLDPISWNKFEICETCGSENRSKVACCN